MSFPRCGPHPLPRPPLTTASWGPQPLLPSSPRPRPPYDGSGRGHGPEALGRGGPSQAASPSHSISAPPLRPRPEMRSERETLAGRLGPKSGGHWRWLRQLVRGRSGLRGLGSRGTAPVGIGAPARGRGAMAATELRRLAGGARVAGPCFSGPIAPIPGNGIRASPGRQSPLLLYSFWLFWGGDSVRARCLEPCWP